MGKPPAEYQRPDGDALPVTVNQIRDLVLEAAGFTPQEAGHLLRKAIKKMAEKLDATKVQYFASEGRVTDERVTEDHQVQLKAAEDLAEIGIDIMGLQRRAANDKATPPAVNIDLSGWQVTAPPKDVTPHATTD